MLEITDLENDSFIKVCPRCGSSNWTCRTTRQVTPLITCKDCTFTGQAVEVDKKGQKELKKNFLEGKKTAEPSSETTQPFGFTPMPKTILNPKGKWKLFVAFLILLLVILGILFFLELIKSFWA